MIVIIIKDNQWTTTNNNTEPWTMNRETWTMHHEPWTMNIFSVMVVLPLTFFIFFIFFEKKILPFFASFVNPLVFTRWRRTPGCYSATWMNNNNNFIKQQHWTMNIFFSDGGLTPHFFFRFIFWEEGLTLLRFICQSSGLHQVERTSWSSPGGAGRAQKSPHDAGR